MVDLTARSDRELNIALAEAKRLEHSIAAMRSQRVALEAHKNMLDDALAEKRRLIQALIDQLNNAEEHIMIHQEQSQILRTLGPVGVEVYTLAAVVPAPEPAVSPPILDVEALREQFGLIARMQVRFILGDEDFLDISCIFFNRN
jgi:hypothetical protein